MDKRNAVVADLTNIDRCYESIAANICFQANFLSFSLFSFSLSLLNKREREREGERERGRVS